MISAVFCRRIGADQAVRAQYSAPFAYGDVKGVPVPRAHMMDDEMLGASVGNCQIIRRHWIGHIALYFAAGLPAAANLAFKPAFMACAAAGPT
jgi:hypothetical protein